MSYTKHRGFGVTATVGGYDPQDLRDGIGPNYDLTVESIEIVREDLWEAEEVLFHDLEYTEEEIQQILAHEGDLNRHGLHARIFAWIENDAYIINHA